MPNTENGHFKHFFFLDASLVSGLGTCWLGGPRGLKQSFYDGFWSKVHWEFLGFVGVDGTFGWQRIDATRIFLLGNVFFFRGWIMYLCQQKELELKKRIRSDKHHVRKKSSSDKQVEGGQGVYHTVYTPKNLSWILEFMVWERIFGFLVCMLIFWVYILSGTPKKRQHQSSPCFFWDKIIEQRKVGPYRL